MGTLSGDILKKYPLSQQLNVPRSRCGAEIKVRSRFLLTQSVGNSAKNSVCISVHLQDDAAYKRHKKMGPKSGPKFLGVPQFPSRSKSGTEIWDRNFRESHDNVYHRHPEV